MVATVHVGLGTIGLTALQATVRTGKGRPVAGVDPLHAGQRLAHLAKLEGVAGEVHETVEEALRSGPAVAIICTASTVEALMPDLRVLIRAGVNVISTCEALAYPWLRTPELAVEIHQMAYDAGVSVVGTGINPGFLLDALPVFLARPVVELRRLQATRIVNTARRRRQLQEKTGVGLTVEEFAAKARIGEVGHVGLGESAALVAKGLGWDVVPEAIVETLEPVIAQSPVASDYFRVQPGQVRGQLQALNLEGPGGRSIHLLLKMALGEEEEYDEVVIDGDPPLHARLLGGVFGDTATVGCTANIIPQVVEARPGLITVLELPPA